MQKKVGKRVTRLETYEEKRALVSKFNLTSDIFFSKVMEDMKACEEVIRIFTGEKFIVKKVETQYTIRNMEAHSVVLDVLAENDNGCLNLVARVKLFKEQKEGIDVMCSSRCSRTRPILHQKCYVYDNKRAN